MKKQLLLFISIIIFFINVVHSIELSKTISIELNTSIYAQTNDLPPPLYLTTPTMPGGGKVIGLYWDKPDSIEPLGYNVYRDGQLINPDTIFDTHYSDLEVEYDTTYTYYVTALYNEGESPPSNTAVGWAEPPGVVVIASSGENGTISPEGYIPWAEGYEIEFEIIADSGYVIKSLTLNNNIIDQATGLSEYTYIYVADEWWDSIYVDFVKGTNNITDPISLTSYFVFPNPASTKLYINLAKCPNFRYDIVIYSAMGQRVKILRNANGIVPIEISDIPDGVYFITLTNKNQLIGKATFIKKIP